MNSDKKRNLFLHFALKQSLMSQYNPRKGRYYHRDKYRHDEAERVFFHAVDEVHSEE